MSTKVMGIFVVMLSLLLVAPLSAKGPGNGNNSRTVNSLTDKEIEHVQYLREEEKLARDVYLTLSEHYQAPIFTNISESEQRHMDAVKRIIDKYGLTDPVVNDDVGAFTHPEFVKLYADLVAKGKRSYCDALEVGIAIEELDISDIEHALNDIEATDVIRVFNNLLAGSYNHLNAFNSQFETNNCE